MLVELLNLRTGRWQTTVHHSVKLKYRFFYEVLLDKLLLQAIGMYASKVHSCTALLFTTHHQAQLTGMSSPTHRNGNRKQVWIVLLRKKHWCISLFLREALKNTKKRLFKSKSKSKRSPRQEKFRLRSSQSQNVDQNQSYKTYYLNLTLREAVCQTTLTPPGDEGKKIPPKLCRWKSLFNHFWDFFLSTSSP